MALRRKWGPCAEVGCPTLTSETRCDVHRPEPWKGSTRRARLPSNWAALVAFVLKRDRSTCYLCGTRAGQVDHVIQGDDHRVENLAAICTPCHLSKSGREGALSPRRKRR